MTRLRLPPQSITEKINQLNTQVEQLQDQLVQSQRFATLGMLSSVLAHELNNILMAILNRAEVAKSSDNPETMRVALDKTTAWCDKASAIIQGMLGFAGADADEVQTARAAQLVEDALALMIRDPAKDGIKVEREFDEALTVSCRPVELAQVVLNLLVNARHAMASGGGTLTVRVFRENEYVAVAVRDTGVGIPPENMEKIFEPFFTTRKSGGGTGLGLYVTRDIVRRHGGDIGVVSRPGQGSTFTVYLPEAPAGPPN
jgi:signal transduction histidine kinase